MPGGEDDECLVAPTDDAHTIDSDEEADLIIDRLRRRRTKEREEEEVREAREAQDRATLSRIVQPFWGAAAKAAARKTMLRRRLDEARQESQASAAREAAALRMAQGEVMQNVLTDADWLWSLFTLRETVCFGDNAGPRQAPAVDGALHEFGSCASVCKAWRDALTPLLHRRRVVLHGHQLPRQERPPPSPPLERPCFAEVAPTGELIVSAANQLMLLSPASTPSSASSRPSSAWEQRTLCSGGSGPGQVYYPHGLQVSPDGRSVFVADRSNHRVQHLRLQDPYRGAAIDCTVGGDGATELLPCEFCAFCPPSQILASCAPHPIWLSVFFHGLCLCCEHRWSGTLAR
jgi:hypothetical protein